jgi:hypothetical protein
MAGMAETTANTSQSPKFARWGRAFLYFAAGLSLLIVAFFWIQTRRDPFYHGKRLSDHLYAAYQPFIFPRVRPINMQAFTAYAQTYPAMHEQARAALTEIGAGSIPLLDSWLRERPNSLRLKIRNWSSTDPRFNWLTTNRWVSMDREAIAHKAAQFIPQFGEPLLPALSEQIITRQSPEAVKTLIQILDRLSPERRSQLLKENQPLIDFAFEQVKRQQTSFSAASILTAFYKRLPSDDRESIVRRLLPCHTHPGVDSFIWLLDETGVIRHLHYLQSGKPLERVVGAKFFRENSIAADRAIPVLIENLRSHDGALLEQACLALANYGPKAKPALPLLRTCADGQPQYVAVAASRAAASIEP